MEMGLESVHYQNPLNTEEFYGFELILSLIIGNTEYRYLHHRRAAC